MPELLEYLAGLPALPAADGTDKTPVLRDGTLHTAAPVTPTQYAALLARITLLEGAVSPTPPPTAGDPIQVLTLPRFGPAGTILKVGDTVTRESGTYVNGIAIAGRRLRGSVEIAGGTSAAYTLTTADLGALVYFLETVRNSITGEEIEVTSEGMGPVLPTGATGLPLETFDFTGTPSGVAVARAGATATRRSSATAIEVMAANSLRYQYSAAGVKLGLLCEKAATNLYPNAINVGAAMTQVGSATITSNYGIAPNGLTQTTRILVAGGGGGTGGSGGQCQIHNVTAGRRVFLCVKASVAGQTFVLSNENTGAYEYHTTIAGTLFLELLGTAALPSNYYGFRVLSYNADSLDIEVWGAGVQLGTDATQTLVATSGTSATRPKEVLTFTLATPSVQRDIIVTDSAGAKQAFLNATVDASAHWSLDADTLSILPIIRQVDVYPPGGAPGGGATEPPAPAPAPPPSSIADLIVADMAGSVDAHPVGTSGAWSLGGSVTMGHGFSGAAAPSWWSGGSTAQYKADLEWNRMENWWFINRSAAGVASNNGRIHVYAVQSLIQLISTDEWILLAKSNAPGAEYYPASGSGAPTGAVNWRQGAIGREFKFDANPANSNIHGYGSQRDVSQYLGNIKAACTAIVAHLVLDNPNGADDLDSCLYLGACGSDAYPNMTVKVADFGVGYNPGMGNSRFKFITRDPQIFIFMSLRNAKEVSTSTMTLAEKTITEAIMRQRPPPISMT